MKTTPSTKLVTVGDILAEVQVEWIGDPNEPLEWETYLSAKDIKTLERVRCALDNGDLKTATRDAKLFKMIPVAAE